jgi:hypothetical protein
MDTPLLLPGGGGGVMVRVRTGCQALCRTHMLLLTNQAVDAFEKAKKLALKNKI